MSDELAAYRRQSPFTDPGACASLLDDMPSELAELRKIVSGLVFHYRAHGDVTDHGFERTRLTEIDLRYAELMLARLAELQPGRIDSPRPADRRILGCCRDTAVLLVSFARHLGIPARVRVGFAAYIIPGWYLDHVVAEVWDGDEGRWRLIDADMPAEHVDVDRGVPLEVLDVPRDRFLVGARAWQLAREGEVDPERFVVSPDAPPFLRGLTYLAHNLVFDLAALNRRELLLWDSWGMLLDEEPPEDDRGARLDALAARLDDPGCTTTELEQLFDADDLRVPDVVVTESPPVPTATRLRT